MMKSATGVGVNKILICSIIRPWMTTPSMWKMKIILQLAANRMVRVKLENFSSLPSNVVVSTKLCITKCIHFRGLCEFYYVLFNWLKKPFKIQSSKIKTNFFLIESYDADAVVCRKSKKNKANIKKTLKHSQLVWLWLFCIQNSSRHVWQVLLEIFMICIIIILKKSAFPTSHACSFSIFFIFR